MNRQYDNTNRGFLIENDRARNSKAPQWTGSINVDGKEYWLSCWDGETQNGKPKRSLTVRPKEASNKPASTRANGRTQDGGSREAARAYRDKDVPARAEPFQDDDIPF